MKKSLMATTALVAASVAVSGAHAQDEMMAEPISLSVGGNMYWGVHVASGDYFDHEDNDEKEGLGIAYDGEVQFKGKTVLDNGLEVGVRFELEGEDQHSGDSETETRVIPVFGPDGLPVMEDGEVVTEEVTVVTEVSDDDDTIDEAYAYVSGSFGELRIGVDDPANYIMATAAPYATYLYAANTPYWSGSISTDNGVGWHTTFLGSGTDSTSLMYFTPVVNGFQLGLSYAPEWGAKPGGGSSITGNDEGKEAWSIAARYDGSFSEQNSVTATVGMLNRGDDPNATEPSEDWTGWSAGLVLSRGAISVGGSYANVDDGSENDNVTYDIGASYSTGPWTVSLTWLHNEDDDTNDDGTVKADNDLYRLLGKYSLGGGVNVAGGLGIDKPDNGNDVTYLGAALQIDF